jgi:hypothetical protein
MLDSIFNFLQQAKSFWRDSALSDPPKTGKVDEYAGEAIAWAKYKEEHDKMFDDHVKELDSNLNPKSW